MVQIVKIVTVSTKTMINSQPIITTATAALPLNLLPWYANEFLLIHNNLRQIHNAQLMDWNSSVASVAQAFASEYECGSPLKHLGIKYGENLASGYSNFTTAMYAWYNESKDYDYSKNNEYNHFTQMVWNASTQLGCAVKSCTESTYYIVCNYYPQGNIIGYSITNVFPIS